MMDYLGERESPSKTLVIIKDGTGAEQVVKEWEKEKELKHRVEVGIRAHRTAAWLEGEP